jgi:hypothetical protein
MCEATCNLDDGHSSAHYFISDVLDNKCFMSFAGWGDGIYEMYVHHTEDGQIDAIRVEFITE